MPNAGVSGDPKRRTTPKPNVFILQKHGSFARVIFSAKLNRTLQSQLMQEHLIQWSTAEQHGIPVLLFVYSRSTREYGIKSLYSPCKRACLKQIVQISESMEALPFRLLENPDDFLVFHNTISISWKKCVAEFRSGEFCKIVEILRKEHSFS